MSKYLIKLTCLILHASVYVCVCNFIFLFQYFALLLSVFKKQFQKDLINLGQAEWRFAGDFLEMWPRS